MHYMFLIYSNEKNDPKYATQEFSDMMEGYGKFNQVVRKDGSYILGEPLESVKSATTVRVKNNETLVTDGPFAETKEVLGGFYILDCKDLDAAIEYAKQIPTASYGSIEIRPIMKIDVPGV